MKNPHAGSGFLRIDCFRYDFSAELQVVVRPALRTGYFYPPILLQWTRVELQFYAELDWLGSLDEFDALTRRQLLYVRRQAPVLLQELTDALLRSFPSRIGLPYTRLPLPLPLPPLLPPVLAILTLPPALHDKLQSLRLISDIHLPVPLSCVVHNSVLNLIKMNSNLNQLFTKYMKGASLGSFLLAGLGYLALNSYYYVDVGHYAIKFNKLFGLSPQVYREGYNLKLPFIEQPIIYNVQTRENQIFAETANRDMQSIKLSVRVLFHPEVSKLDVIYTRLGKNYEQKVLPAICNQILRTVVAQFSANQLLSQRDQVSERIKTLLSERAAHFNIIIDNLAITDLTFGKEYLEAIEGKQVAQQEAERAKYEVEQAKQAKKSTIIKAQASAKSIELVGQASKNNPSYLDVRKIEYTEKIAQILAESRNKLLLNNDILNMSLPKTTNVSYEERPDEKAKK